MKIVAIEISINHSDDTAEDRFQSSDENSTLAMTRCIEDTTPTGPVVEELSAELLRRYKVLNSRKTN